MAVLLDISAMTQEERNLQQKIRRKLNGNAETHKYEKTPKGFLMRLYRNMQSRITGVQKAKWHLYKDKYLLPRDSFYNWALNSPDFYFLYTDWVRSGYTRKLTPTVDRIDPAKGYELSNMRWLTHSENSRLGSINAHLATSRPTSATFLFKSRN